MLNGYVEGPRFRENRCQATNSIRFSVTDWERELGGISTAGARKYQIENIPASKISNKYCMIINPFGENYPEKDRKSRPIFDKIKDYEIK